MPQPSADSRGHMRLPAVSQMQRKRSRRQNCTFGPMTGWATTTWEPSTTGREKYPQAIGAYQQALKNHAG